MFSVQIVWYKNEVELCYGVREKFSRITVFEPQVERRKFFMNFPPSLMSSFFQKIISSPFFKTILDNFVFYVKFPLLKNNTFIFKHNGLSVFSLNVGYLKLYSYSNVFLSIIKCFKSKDFKIILVSSSNF